MHHKRNWLCSFSLLLLFCLLFSVAASEDTVQLKKITADVREISLYAGQVSPLVVTIAADPADASLEGLTLAMNKEGICTAELDGNQLRVLPLAVGKTSLTLAAGKIKLNLPVSVLEPVTGLTITSKGTASPGGKVTYSAVTEPKNAANKQVEWTVEGGDGKITITNKGVVAISADCDPGTPYTVKCQALGADIPVQAEKRECVVLSKMPLSSKAKAAFKYMQNLVIPPTLQNLSLTSPKGWIPSDMEYCPETAQIEAVDITGNELYIKADRAVSDFYIAEWLRDGTINHFWSSHESPFAIDVRYEMMDPNSRVEVIVQELPEGYSRLFHSYSRKYTLRRSPIRLAAEPNVEVEIDLDSVDYPPYRSTGFYPLLSVEYLYKENTPVSVKYTLGDDEHARMEFHAKFKGNGQMRTLEIDRLDPALLGENDPWTTIKFNENGDIVKMLIATRGVFSCTFDKSELKFDRPAMYKALEKKYPGISNYSGIIYSWNLSLDRGNDSPLEVQFVTTEDLFTHEANGDMIFHPEVRDFNGAPFPFAFLGELIGPGTFAYPNFTKE